MVIGVGRNENILWIVSATPLGLSPFLFIQLSYVFQFVSWLTFLHVSYYSLAFRINQLTLYFQKREELIESNVDYDKDNEDDAIVPKLDILNKR